MQSIFHMALKDIKLIRRDRMGLFFIVFFPILMGVFFGLMMGGFGSGGSGKMKIAVVDQDQSDMSAKFVELLVRNESLQVETAAQEAAGESVRKGERVGLILLPAGFGERAGAFWGDPPEVQLGLDPSRNAESAMLQGFVMQAIGGLVGERFQNPQSFRPMIEQSREEAESADMSPAQRTLLNGFLDSIESMIQSADQLTSEGDRERGEATGKGFAAGGGMPFANITTLDITRKFDPDSQQGQLQKLRSRWDISFPQAMLWGVLGCIASFSISIARENTLGTMLRLQVAPLRPASILAGKALACFLTALGVIGLLTLLGVLLGMQPGSYPKLVVASLCTAGAFTGIMMVISLLGRTEQGVSGAGWAANMIMAMLGGCMIPTMFMPEFIRNLGVISPVRWAIQAIEGAVWREYSWAEMMMPLAILLAIGAVCFFAGSAMMKRRLS
jgi:ABC-2 type transport system permease protein